MQSPKLPPRATIILAAVSLLFLLFISTDLQCQETILYSFGATNGDGQNPNGDLVQDANGNLYGTTNLGGVYDAGTVFEVSPNGTENVLYSFGENVNDGLYPSAGLIFDQLGNLWGTTGGGGPFDNGTVFELSPNQNGGWTETFVYLFCGENCGNGAIDGANPDCKLVEDQQGNFYGTTENGGAGCGGYGCGTVFELSPNGTGGYSESLIHVFAGSDGFSPISGLAMDAGGNLYGTVESGGITGCGNPSGCGLVYKMSPSPDGWTFSVIQLFTGFDGAGPISEVILDAHGNLYGTALYGGFLGPCSLQITVAFSGYGGPGCGTVFELSPNGNSYLESVLYRFAGGNDGANPIAHLTLISGNLYGTTVGGGGGCGPPFGCGTVFELTPNAGGGWTESILSSFNFSDGAAPGSALQVQQADPLHPGPPAKRGCTAGCGSCMFGGTYDDGVIYKFQ